MALNICRVTFTMLQRPFSTAKRKEVTTAGIVVIGDEILKGQTQDTNSRYLARELYKMGVHVKKISVIGDIVNEVCQEVRGFSRSFDYVLTTGGIGPTHDDITYAAVARAFSEPLILDPILKELCLKFYNTTNVDNPGMKMAYIPQSAKLNFKSNIASQPLVYPNISIQNVYMFPGIPEFLMRTFSSVKDTIFKSSEHFFSKSVYLNTSESDIVQILDRVVHEYPEVQFGSYPKMSNKQYQVKLTVESCCEESTKTAYDKLIQLLPQGSIVNGEEIDES